MEDRVERARPRLVRMVIEEVDHLPSARVVPRMAEHGCPGPWAREWGPEDVADLMAAPQVWRELFSIISKAAEIDNAA